MKPSRRTTDGAQAELIRSLCILILALLLVGLSTVTGVTNGGANCNENAPWVMAFAPVGAGDARRRSDWGVDHRARRVNIYSRRQVRPANFGGDDPPDPPFILVVLFALTCVIWSLWGFVLLDGLARPFVA